MTLKHGFLSRGIMSRTSARVTKHLATRRRCFSANAHLSLIFLLCYWLGEDVHSSPTEQTQTFKLIQETSKGTGKGELQPLLPGCENLFVLQLLHPGGGGHRHGDDDIVYIKGALTSPPLDRLLLENNDWFIRNIKLDTDCFTKSLAKK